MKLASYTAPSELHLEGRLHPLILAVVARSLSQLGRLEVIAYMLRYEAEAASSEPGGGPGDVKEKPNA